MNTLVEEFEHDGLKCEIHWEDSSFCDPRYADNLGVMYCWHPDYVLGDEQFTRDDHDSMEDVYNFLKFERQAICILPLTIYDHSGVTMFVGGKHDYPFDSAGWDTTHTGYIYTTEERVQQLCGEDPEYRELRWLEEQLRQEVKVYATWLEGEVYWWQVLDTDGETLDSCGGYVGEIDYVREEAKSSAEYYRKEILVNQEPNFPEGLKC